MDNMLRVEKAIEIANIFINDLKEGGKNFFSNRRTIGTIFYTNREIEEIFKEIFPVRNLGNIDSFLWGISASASFSTSQSLNYIKNMEQIKIYLEDYLKNYKNNTIEKKVEDGEMDNTKVFIVHGHDNESKQETARFIEQLGLEAIILHEQASKGQTIIEKIEENSNVGFAVVLYTPCDEGKAKNKEHLQNRARQNVVFEHGYLIGKLGRSRVCALVKGDLEKPNDISGIIYINIDNAGAWKMDLVKEMHSAGYDIDISKMLKK